MLKRMLRRSDKTSSPAGVAESFETDFLPERYFLSRLRQEQKRTERSRRPFVLVLIEAPSLFGSPHGNEHCEKVLCALGAAIRETDTGGWYQQGSTAGIIFTEINETDRLSIAETLLSKIGELLELTLGVVQASQIKLSFHVFPEDWDGGHSNRSGSSVLHPELSHPHNEKKVSLAVKRGIDVAGSLLALLVGSPLLAVIALTIKLTSKGPVLFRQRRVGRYGNPFTFLKFRSMYVGNNQAIHKEFVKNLIGASETGAAPAKEATKVVYKIINDPRVTAVGRFLRKTSLDELPQFFNVLTGEMSLVGPRPPIPYEVESYDVWHRRRLLEVRPGITGLWQVMGRSRTTFDDMVRLDLEYATSWSLWLDLKILFKTPLAVFAGNGAY